MNKFVNSLKTLNHAGVWLSIGLLMFYGPAFIFTLTIYSFY